MEAARKIGEIEISLIVERLMGQQVVKRLQCLCAVLFKDPKKSSDGVVCGPVGGLLDLEFESTRWNNVPTEARPGVAEVRRL